ncbi:MAG: hypothetical protein JSV86_06235 [Gemmatimonadota bacterium]|nr:MAG: hypothetical protein JSV86_06235 [Gemmatimonadota bacterium]
MSEPITENEALRRALVIFPDAYIGEDSEKQLVIYTGLYPTGTVTVTERVYGPEPKIMELAPNWRNTSDEHQV